MAATSNKLGFLLRASLVTLSYAAVATSPAAAATTIDSSAYGLFVDLNVAAIVGAGIGPVAATAGTAAPAYNNSTTIASVDQSVGLESSLGLTFAQGLSTGLLVSTATSAFPTSPTGDASATVNNLDLSLAATPIIGGPLTLLSFGSSEIVSTSSVEGFGLPSASGFTSIAGLTVSGLALGGLTIDGSLFANPAANFELFDGLGLRIVLNEQLPGGDGVTGAGIATNAIHVVFSNFLLGANLLNGNIIVSHSQAQIAGIAEGVPSVPEPAVWLQLIVGFGAVGVIGRRYRVSAA